MKIAISNSIFFTQKSGGISRYFVEISKQIIKENNIDLKIISPINKNYFLKDISKKNKISLYLQRYPNLKVLNKFNNFLCQFYINKFSPNIFHESYYSNNFNFKKKISKVITIYDTIHENFPEYYSKEKINQKKKIIDKYDHFICISENTKKNFMELYKVPEAKISVTYLAGNHFTNLYKNKTLKNEEDIFLLYVGPRKLYKNFEIIYNTIKKNKNLKNIKVLCFGGEKFTDEEKRNYSKFNIQQIYGSNEDLFKLYCSAACLIVSSKYEGFCLPIVEAMKLGCPVISSDNPAAKEIGMDAVIFFNQDSVDDLSHKIQKTLYDTSFRNFYVKKGLEREKFFSWEKCAKETLGIYKTIL
tara:strand:+ start:6171 stop:7244 length:1074 start_codon:yes stop_codon:yes gene_type:complete